MGEIRIKIQRFANGGGVVVDSRDVALPFQCVKSTLGFGEVRNGGGGVGGRGYRFLKDHRVGGKLADTATDSCGNLQIALQTSMSPAGS